MTVTMTERVTTYELMIAAAIAVTTFQALPVPWPSALGAGVHAPVLGAGRFSPVMSGTFQPTSSPELAGSISSESTARVPFACPMKVFYS